MKRLDAELLGRILAEWASAPHGGRKAVLEQHLPALGLSQAAFYKEARRWGYLRPRRGRADRGKRQDPRREAWVQAIIQVKHRPPAGVRGIVTEDAVRLAVRDGLVPPEAARVPAGTYNWLARELGLVEVPRRENRFQAAYPNQVHQFDASGSEHFIPVRREGEDWVLKLRRRRQKNRDQAEKLKVWAYGLCDDFSGYRLARYTVAAGESALDGIAFLRWAWAAHPEHAPFQGWPEVVYLDNGPVAKLGAFRRFCGQLGVEILTHEPYRSQATGKVENNWRTAWNRFENLFFADPGWESRTLLLSELNSEFYAFWREWNTRRHRRLQMGRDEAWLLINHRGGPVSVAPEAWSALSVQRERLLDGAGCFDLEGYTYQVKEIRAGKATVLKGLTDGAVWVVEEGSGRRFRARPFEAKLWGEFAGTPKSALEELLAGDAREIPAARPVVCGPGDGKVVHLVRPGETRQMAAGGDARPTEEGGALLEELAGAHREGAQVDNRRHQVQGDNRGCREGLYATPLERYAVVKVKEILARPLTEEEAAFLRQVEADYGEQVELLRDGIETRARLAAVE
jgi:hypothetical protein